jgi:hypothetical protein
MKISENALRRLSLVFVFLTGFFWILQGVSLFLDLSLDFSKITESLSHITGGVAIISLTLHYFSKNKPTT